MDRVSSEEIFRSLSETLTKVSVGFGASYREDEYGGYARWDTADASVNVFCYHQGDEYYVHFRVDVSSARAAAMYMEVAADQVRAGKGFLLTREFPGVCDFEVEDGATCRWVQRELVTLKRVCDESFW
jgi:hypothetical protein